MNMIFGFDPTVAQAPPKLVEGSWAGRKMLIVYTDSVPVPGEKVTATMGIIGMQSQGRPSRAQAIYSKIAFPNWAPGARRFKGETTDEMIAEARQNGGIACRVEPLAGGGARGLIYALTPGTRADFPAWGDANARAQLQDLLSNLEETFHV